MDGNATTVLILIGVLVVLFIVALFYMWQQGKKKPKQATPTPESTPKAAKVEAPKEAEVVKTAPEPMQAAVVETPKEAEVVKPTPEPIPPAAEVEAPKEAEVVKTVPEPMQAAVVETPKEEETAIPITEPAPRPVKAAPPKETAPKRRERGTRISEIEGIGPANAEKLNSMNISTTLDLLESGATPRGRKEIADTTGISPKLILEWVNLADLFRIKGIGEEYSDLLEEAGVDTVAELSRRNAENLHAKIVEVNEAQKLVRRTPSLASVENWIKEAKGLPRKVEY